MAGCIRIRQPSRRDDDADRLEFILFAESEMVIFTNIAALDIALYHAY